MNGKNITRGLLATTLTLCLGPIAARAEVVKYVDLDALGNVRVVTDQNGNVVERHDYLPFGEEWCPGPPAGVCASVPPGQPRRFTGKERDAETGLDYFGARYYGSRIARFTTVDPVYTWRDNLVDPQRWNRYAFGRNNPLRYVDPDGREIVVQGLAARLAWAGSIRAKVAAFFGAGDPNQGALQRGAEVAVDTILSIGLPQNAFEAEAQLFGFAAPIETGAARILANRAAGKAAEAKMAEEIHAEGNTILGSQVSYRTSLGRRVTDHLVQDEAGGLTNLEVKSGNATRNAIQRAKDTEIAAGRATMIGKNAPERLSSPW